MLKISSLLVILSLSFACSSDAELQYSWEKVIDSSQLLPLADVDAESNLITEDYAGSYGKFWGDNICSDCYNNHRLNFDHYSANQSGGPFHRLEREEPANFELLSSELSGPSVIQVSVYIAAIYNSAEYILYFNECAGHQVSYKYDIGVLSQNNDYSEWIDLGLYHSPNCNNFSLSVKPHGLVTTADAVRFRDVIDYDILDVNFP